MLSLVLLLSVGETLLLLLFFFVIGFILLVGVCVIIYKLLKNRQNVSAFQKLSQQTGLQMTNPKKPFLKGVYNDCEVELAISFRRVGTGEDSYTEHFTYCESYFPYSLRFLLDISCPQGWFSRALGSNDVKLGHTAFDNKFTLKCYDANVARRLLLSDFPSDNSQNLMGDLMLAGSKITYIDVTDHEVYTEETGQIANIEQLKQMLNTTTHLAKRFRVAREKFPLADWEKQLFHSWQKIAKENNLRVDTNHLQMQGFYKNFPILVSIDTKGGRWQTNIKLKFPESLMVGLKLMPENSIHKALSWFGVQDIQIGIKKFDDAFIVKGKNVQMAKYKLQPNVCNQLLALSKQTNNFLIDDTSMSFTYNSVLGSEKMLKSQIEGMISTAKLLLD